MVELKGQVRASDRSLALLALVATAAACLPRGEPPSGRQVIADRRAKLAAIAPPNGDGVLRILIFRPGATTDSRDLYAVSVDGTDAPPSERLLIANLDITADLGCIGRIAPCSIDAAGWTYVYTKGGGFGAAVAVNTITGDQKIFDFRTSPLSSASGQRFFSSESSAAGAPSLGTLHDPDGRTMTFEVAGSSSLGATYSFYGEDFYYLTPEGVLMRIPPTGAPEPLATTVGGFYGYPAPDGAVLILIRPTDQPEVRTYAAYDSVTGRETALPFSGIAYSLDVQPSPDGRWLLLTDGGNRRFTFLDVRSGAAQDLPFPDDYFGFSGAWRPGTFQIWVTTGGDQNPAVAILSRDAPTVFVPGVRFAGFSEDGAYWLSTATSPNETLPVLQVGPADDPTGPRRFLTPPGKYLNESWPRADHQWLMTVYTKDGDRSDVMTFDLASGESRLLAERGRMAVVGDTRFVGMFRQQSWRGDLTVVEIDTGKQTILAPEFAVTAFAEPQGTDLVAPGTRVVYEFQARSESPYDGIWVVNAP